MRVALVGWFSFSGHGATAGDLLARDVVLGWLHAAGRDVDVVVAPPFTDGVGWEAVDPLAYHDLVFVCGPFGNGRPLRGLLRTFAHCRIYAVDVSLMQPTAEWNPFTAVWPRDGDGEPRPDVALLASPASVPVVGRILAQRQSEYRERALHENADAAVRALLAERDVAVVPIDTRLDPAQPDLPTAASVVSLIARMDAVVTTRLHGLVLALRQGVPVVPVDPIRGGAKIRQQVEALGWPLSYGADRLDPEELREGLDWCLTEEARGAAVACAARAAGHLEAVRESFQHALGGGEGRAPGRTAVRSER